MNFLNNLTTVLNQSLNDGPTYKNVIDEKNNNQVSIVTYNKNTVPMDSCCITMNNFEEGEKIAKLPCNHYFSMEAIMGGLLLKKLSVLYVVLNLNQLKLSIQTEKKKFQKHWLDKPICLEIPL